MAMFSSFKEATMPKPRLSQPRRWRAQSLRKPREWHGKRIQCRGRVGNSSTELELPITKVDVDAKVIYDTALQVTLTQTFQHNFVDTNGPLTVSYIFPLESTSAVYSMRAVLSSGVEIEGIIKEKEEAKQEFDTAVRSGHQAVLVSQLDGDIFQFDVGNVAPGESVDIIVSYMTILEHDSTSESTRLFLPRSITPRFGANDLTAIPGHINYQMAVRVDIRTRSRALNVQCISHPHALRVSRDEADDRHMILTLGIGVDSEGMEKDIVALISEEDPQQTNAVYEFSNTFKTHAFLVSFVAQPMDDVRGEGGIEGLEETKMVGDAEGDNSGVELIFLVDKSGSMSGGAMRTVKKTLKKFLRSMPENCKFNLISFNNSHECFRPESVVYNDSTFDAANGWIDKLNANGGTQLYSALDYVLNSGYDPLRARNIFVLTDGAVSNTKKCIKLVDRVGDDVRFFTFGIGSGHSTELVNGLAEAGNGTSTAISDLNDIGSKVLGTLTTALQPVIGDINVMIQSPPNEGTPLKFDIFPRKIPAMFYGRRTVFYAVAHESVDFSPDLGLSVTLTGRENGTKPYKMHIPIDASPYSDEGDVPDPYERFSEYFASGEGEQEVSGETRPYFGETKVVPRAMQLCAARSDGLVVHRLAARARIQELEHRSSHLKEARTKKEIIALATRFNLASSHTSFIAVHRDQEGREREGDVVTRKSMEIAVQQGGPHLFSAMQHFRSGPRGVVAEFPECSMRMRPARARPMGRRQNRRRKRCKALVHQPQAESQTIETSVAPQSKRIWNVMCPCGAKFDFINARRVYGGSGICCDMCSGNFEAGFIYHCPQERVPAHAEGYDLCPGCARLTHYGSPTRTCTCGSTLQCVSMKEAYSGGGVICDSCGVHVREDVAYHCPRERIPAHSSGYDLCRRCATSRSDLKGDQGPPSSVDELTDLQLANGSFKDQVLIYAKYVPGLDALCEELLSRGIVDESNEETVRRTLAALALLQKLFAVQSGEWQLIQRKAVKFVSNATGRPRTEIDSWVVRLLQ